MTGLTYTLLGDGTSDRLLDYPIRWRRPGSSVGRADFSPLKAAPAFATFLLALESALIELGHLKNAHEAH